MNKYKFTLTCQDNNTLGLISDAECMYLILDKWAEENGGHMNESELADMVEYLENEMGWYWMARMIHGYFWGASTDNERELKGEQLRKVTP